jgi:hypothetical protein
MPPSVCRGPLTAILTATRLSRPGRAAGPAAPPRPLASRVGVRVGVQRQDDRAVAERLLHHLRPLTGEPCQRGLDKGQAVSRQPAGWASFFSAGHEHRRQEGGTAAGPGRFELPPRGLEVRRSIRLSYGPVHSAGVYQMPSPRDRARPAPARHGSAALPGRPPSGRPGPRAAPTRRRPARRQRQGQAGGVTCGGAAPRASRTR